MTEEQMLELNDTLSRFIADHDLNVPDDRLDDAVWAVASIVNEEA